MLELNIKANKCWATQKEPNYKDNKNLLGISIPEKHSKSKGPNL